MKIRVCIPFYSEFEATKNGLLALKEFGGIEFDIVARQGSSIGYTRNSLINDLASIKICQTPAKGYDYFLMVDSDISFTLDDVLRLISHEKSICCAPYTMHSNPKLYSVGYFKTGKPGFIDTMASVSVTGFHRVDWSGAGFMLIKREVFSKMRYPWYRHNMVKISETEQDETGEDIGFCMGARNAGIDIWCDFDIKIKHTDRNKKSFDWKIEMEKELI